MSLEAQIEVLNSNIVALIATLQDKATTPATKPAKVAPPAEEKSAPKTDTPAAEAKTLTQADVAPTVADFVKAHGRDAAIELLKPFRGIKKLGEAKPEEFAGILAAFQKATAAS